MLVLHVLRILEVYGWSGGRCKRRWISCSRGWGVVRMVQFWTVSSSTVEVWSCCQCLGLSGQARVCEGRGWHRITRCDMKVVFFYFSNGVVTVTRCWSSRRYFVGRVSFVDHFPALVVVNTKFCHLALLNARVVTAWQFFLTCFRNLWSAGRYWNKFNQLFNRIRNNPRFYLIRQCNSSLCNVDVLKER